MIIRILQNNFLVFFIYKLFLLNNQYFKEGVIFLITKNLMRQNLSLSKILFLILKSEMSYLYLSKIFKNLKKKI